MTVVAASKSFSQDDHPLISQYAGSTIQKKDAEEFGQYQFVTGRTAQGEFSGETLKGKVTRIVYGNPAGRSTLEIFSNYKKALDEIAKLLKARPGLDLFVVGHTDMTGNLAHNRTLSEARAQAVVAALVKDYGIAGTRLEGHGIGPLAPAAANATSDGRVKNRRVELVAR
jgi:outer membrane protein OmpA-like peptidoglycan-associated protein